MCAKLLQSCSTLCIPMDCRPPCPSVHGILWGKNEWVAMPSSRGSYWPGDQTHNIEPTVSNPPAAVKALQSRPTLCDPVEGSPPGSPVPGILQARTLEWVASSFSNAWKWKVKVKSLSRVRLLATPAAAAAKSLQSCPTLCDPIDGSPLGSSVPGIL